MTRVGIWIRDFVGFGAGVGALAPLAWIVPTMWLHADPQLAVLMLVTGFAGALCGTVAGALMAALGWWLEPRPLLLLPLGFPVGFVAGGTVGWLGGGLFASQAAPIGAVLGAITGGLLLGLLWLPYLAVQRRGRPGWPVFAVGALLSPVAGATALGSAFLIGL